MRIAPTSWLIFGILEFLAVVAWFCWPSVPWPALSAFLWGTQLVLLLPGSIGAVAITEGPLWGHGIPLMALAFADLVLSIAFNALIFWGVVRLVRSIARGLRSNKSLERTRER
jgi:hypothetical protein